MSIGSCSAIKTKQWLGGSVERAYGYAARHSPAEMGGAITRVIVSTNHLEIICFATGLPLVRLPKPTKSCSDFLYEAERSCIPSRALTGQSRDNSWPPVEGECAGKRYDLGSERSGEHLRYITQPWFQDDLGVVRPGFQASRVDREGLQIILLS